MVCKKTVGSIIEPPSATQLEIIKIDTNEVSEEKLRHNERLMHEWIRCQNHFPKNVDKGLIRAFLRGSKHNLDRAKRKFEHHLSARHLYPEVYSRRSPLNHDVIRAMDVASIAPLPKLTNNGYRIICFRLNNYDPLEFDPPSIIKLFFMIYELVISSDFPFCGDIAIFDFSHFGTIHAAKWFGPSLRTLEKLLREAYAIRLKQIHVINAPPMLVKMMNMIKPMMHPKVRESMYFHSNSQTLLNLFGPDLLPADYNGNLKLIRSLATDWYDVLTDNADWFESQEHVKITGVPKKVRGLFYFKEEIGLEGSFRKLEID